MEPPVICSGFAPVLGASNILPPQPESVTISTAQSESNVALRISEDRQVQGQLTSPLFSGLSITDDEDNCIGSYRSPNDRESLSSFDSISSDADTSTPLGNRFGLVPDDAEEEMELDDDIEQAAFQQIRETTEKKLDGFLVVGDTRNIVRIDGAETIPTLFHIDKEPSLRFKGVPELVAPEHRFKIKLVKVDNGMLALVMLSKSVRPIESSRLDESIVYSKVCQRIQEFLKEELLKLDSKSRNDYRLRGDGNIIIKEEDWERLGNAFRNRLDNLTSEDKTIFPDGVQFKFIFYKFGQDRSLVINDPLVRYPSVRLEKAQRVVVHVAFDQSLPDHLLLFTPDSHTGVGAEPTYTYNIGIMPNIGNYVYTRLPDNSYNILCMQKYTRVFHALHSNLNLFFVKPSIAISMLQLYSDLLHRRKRRLEGLNKKILEGDVNLIYRGVEKMLQENPPVPSRTEFVWSVKIKDVHNLNNIMDVFNEALASCTAHANETNCLDPSQYKVLEMTLFLDYVRKVLRPLFMTIEVCRKKLERFYNTMDPKKVWAIVNHDFLSFKDFSNVYVAEGFIQWFLRGDVSAYANVLRSAIQPITPVSAVAPVQNDKMYEWPFKMTHVWETVGGTIETGLSITSFWRQFTDKCFERRQPGHNELPLHCTQLIKLYETYGEWMKLPITATAVEIERISKRLHESLCYALFQKVLAINKKNADNQLALSKLWDDGNLEPHQIFHVVGSKEIYSILTTQKSVYQVLGLVQIHNFIQLLRTQTLERQKGGFRLAFAVSLDHLMIKYAAPFVIRLPSSAKQYLFAPVTFSIASNVVVEMYRRIFFAKFERTVGLRKIGVTQYLAPFCNYLASLNKEKEGPNIAIALEIINELLDSDQVRNTPAFQNLSRGLQNILKPENYHVFAQPSPRLPSRRNSNLDFTTNDDDGEDEDLGDQNPPQQQLQVQIPVSTKRVTRSVTRKAFEDAERERQMKELLAQEMSPAARNKFENLMKEIFDPAPAQENSNNAPSTLEKLSTRRQTTSNSSGVSTSSGSKSRISNDSDNEDSSSSPKAPLASRVRRMIISDSESDFDEEKVPKSLFQRLDTPRPTPVVRRAHSLAISDDESSCDEGQDFQNVSNTYSGYSSRSISPSSISYSPPAFPSLDLTPNEIPVNQLKFFSSASSRVSPINSDQTPPANLLPTTNLTPPANLTPPGNLTPPANLIPPANPTPPANLTPPAHGFVDNQVFPSPSSQPLNSPVSSESTWSWKHLVCRPTGFNSATDQDEGNASDASSGDSVFSRGYVFRRAKKINTGTYFDTIKLKDSRPIKKAIPRNKPQSNFFSVEETRRIFIFLYNNDLLKYMKGTRVAHLMSELNIPNSTPVRSASSICSHIKTMTRIGRIQDLKGIVGWKIFQEVKKADQHITKTSYTNVLPDEIVKERFGVDMKNLMKNIKK